MELIRPPSPGFWVTLKSCPIFFLNNYILLRNKQQLICYSIPSPLINILRSIAFPKIKTIVKYYPKLSLLEHNIVVPALHLCCTAHKKKRRRLFAQSYDWKRLFYLSIFSCTTFRHSAITPATLLIRKCTTRRWTLKCSHYSVAKRQQFSCALSTPTLSLKFENVVPEG